MHLESDQGDPSRVFSNENYYKHFPSGVESEIPPYKGMNID